MELEALQQHVSAQTTANLRGRVGALLQLQARRQADVALELDLVQAELRQRRAL